MKSALKTTQHWFSLFIFCLLFAGCEPKEFYPLGIEEILIMEKNQPGEIFLITGSRRGQFQKGDVAVGQENTAGILRSAGRFGTPSAIKWPATAGIYYEAHCYINELGGCLYVVKKIKSKKTTP